MDQRDAAEAQYIGRARPVKDSRRIQSREALAPGRGVRAKERCGHPCRLRARVIPHHALPHLARSVAIAQAQVTQADLDERLGHLQAAVLEDLLELDQRLTV